MKKKFILFFGVGWSGTTSLYYTLQNNLQYMHGGFVKELHYLVNYFRPLDQTVAFSLDELLNDWSYSTFKSNLKYDCFDSPLSHFTKSEFNSIIINNPSLKHYLNYYQNLSKYCGEEWSAVGDFSNSNFRLTEQELYEVFSLLNPIFDVKVIFIFRDFIRRVWSQVSSFSLENKKSMILQQSIKKGSPKKLFSGNIEDNIKFETLFWYDYAKKVKEAYKIFGEDNVCYLIMEDFFKLEDNNQEVARLSNFLNIDIPVEKIYPCCYVPDKGINAIYVDNLSDQSTSDHQMLSPEVYYDLKSLEKISQLYSDFEKFHGFLPADWGSAIDYGY
jgi:hypothetical protein